ncbi:hypothetical protein I4U23_022604 [Adineta vaga]|nr:hypothetical protein I4U23_022604 [Adineta vaga]
MNKLTMNTHGAVKRRGDEKLLVSPTKKAQREKTTPTKRKQNRSTTSDSIEKTLGGTGLNGSYWNIAPIDRHVTKQQFDQTTDDDDDDDDESGSTSESEHATNFRKLLYRKKTFLTCRSPADSFYLCQVLENVFNHTKRIRIRWCSFVDENGDEKNIDENTRFKLDYEDILVPQTILTGIEYVIHYADKTISLRKNDIIEIKRLLRKSISAGQKTRKRVISGEAAPIRKRRRTKDIDEVFQRSTKPVTISTAKLFKVQSNRFLKENPTLTNYEIEPFFEDNLPVPFISSSVQSKLAIRAVLRNDPILLKSLINDVDRVSSVHIRRDLPGSLTAIHYAIKDNNIDLLQILVDDLLKPKDDRCPFPQVTMKKQDTGHASIRTLGFRTAKIMASRGAREGNDALIKDRIEVISRGYGEEVLHYAMKNNCSRAILNLLSENFYGHIVNDNVVECIVAGHRKLAASIIDDMGTNIKYGFTRLHREILLFDHEDLVINSPCDVIEKTKANCLITPIHCAAINPNTKYLKQLLANVAEYNIADQYQRRPIHYAAVCEGTEPLEYLLSKNTNLNNVDKDGNSPLHIAVTNGRADNVELLLRTAKEKAESNDANEQLVYEQFGLASIDKLNKSRYSPLHLAVLNNHLECVKILLKFGAKIDVFTSISTEKLTPLMLACQKGYLNFVLYLIENGGKVESRDRFKRTPLIHACVYGNAHIVSHLLRMGANVNVFDSSMNAALHYAVAYGWYFSVRLLMEAGADLNRINCWQTTCLGVGFFKGHFGICDYLLTEHQADVNFKTDEGLTLVMITVGLEISSFSVQQLEYVVEKHNADCICVDINGKNAFHYLAVNRAGQRSSGENEVELKKILCRMAQILLDHQCNPFQLDNKAETPLMLAVKSKNYILLDFFLNQVKPELNSDVDYDGKTFLHYFAMNCDDYRLIQIFLSLPVTDEMKKMCQIADNQSQKPLMYCLSKFDQGCRENSYSNAYYGIQSYQSTVKMIRFCFEMIDEETSNIDETHIFYLLRSVSSQIQTNEHPLEIFLDKTKKVNAIHPVTRRTPLLEAIHFKDMKIIDILLNQSSCDINLAPTECHSTPLILACKLQFLSVIRRLLTDPKCDLLARDDKQNQALHYYLANSTRSDEYLEIFHLFIEKLKLIDITSINSRGTSGRTPLHIAVYHNSGTVDTINVVEQTLIENGCDLFIQDDLGNLPLHDVFIARKTREDPVELCVLILQSMNYQSIDTKNKQGHTPLYLAVTKDLTVCLMLLLKHHADLLIEDNLSNSVIAACIVSNHLNLFITFLHQSIHFDLSKLYRTPIENSSVSMETNSNDNQSWTWKFVPISQKQIVEPSSLIHIIMQRNWQGALSLILDDLNRFHLKHIQVFEAAIFNDRLNLVLRLLSTIKNRTILNEKNSHGRTLFHMFANLQQYDQRLFDKILTHLCNNLADWNTEDNYGSYPLHYACVIHNISFINFLHNKLDFNQTDAFGNTAYSLLFWSTTTKTSFDNEFLRKLIISGRSIDCLCNYDNSITRNPLSFGQINSNVIPYPPDKSDSRIRTSPLINAVVHNHFDLVKFLLELGVDVNYTDEEKLTPLMHAVCQNNIDMVKLLLNPEYSLENKNIRPKTIVQKIRKQPKPRGFFLGVTTVSTNIDEIDDDVPDTIETTDEPETFSVTSGIDLDACDAHGRTCIYYLVQPFPHHTYSNNIELLELLQKSGTSITKQDQFGLTPLQYSVNNGYQHLSQKLTNEPTEVRTTLFSVNDPNKQLLGLPDYYFDAQQFIDEYISIHSSKTVHTVYQVDPLSNMSQTGEIMIDTEKNEPYDVRLTITDVDYGLIGLYNFYRMQIIKHKGKTNLFLLFTRWGRIGDGEGQYQLTPYSTIDECRDEFCKIFREKTGNLWANTDQFQTKPKKYTLIQLNQRQVHKYTNVPIDFQRLQDNNQHLPSKLQSTSYKTLFKTFLNPQTIRVNLSKSQLDVEWMPVSQLRPEILEKARDILRQLKIDIQEKDKLKLIIQQKETPADTTDETPKPIAIEEKNQFKQVLDSICKLTNEYYTIIPLEGYGDEKLPMIDDEAALKVHEQKLDDILELELSYKILLAVQANLNQISPLDYLYKSINCQFEAMNRDDIDSQMILRYIWTSAKQIEVEQIFKIARPNDDQVSFQRNLSNHYLLWHGTNICNLISILTRGLLVAPSCATATGSLFGKGIYTADVFAKSLHYCSGISENGDNRYFMLLCEVALGTSQGLNNECRDLNEPLNFKVHQSRKALGRIIPDPRYTLTRNDGVQIPLGQLIECTDPDHGYHRCQYNEYIVFDESQIALRYLVQFRQ